MTRLRRSWLKLLPVKSAKGSRTIVTESSAIARSDLSSVNSPGARGPIEKVRMFEVAPLLGLNTVTWDVPGLEMSAEEIAAIICDGEMKVVGRSSPFHRITERSPKFSPLTVSVNAALAACAAAGERLL